MISQLCAAPCRTLLLVLMAVEYLGLLWLIACTAATAILLVAGVPRGC